MDNNYPQTAIPSSSGRGGAPPPAGATAGSAASNAGMMDFMTSNEQSNTPSIIGNNYQHDSASPTFPSTAEHGYALSPPSTGREVAMSPSRASAALENSRERLGRRQQNGEDGRARAGPMMMPGDDMGSSSFALSMPAAAAAGSQYATEPDQTSRASSSDGNSLGQSPHLIHDSRPNLKKEPSDNSSTQPFSSNNNNQLSGMDYRHSKNNLHSPPYQSSGMTTMNNHINSGDMGMDFDPILERTNQGTNQAFNQRQELHHHEQQVRRPPSLSPNDHGMGNRMGGTTGYSSNAVNNNNNNSNNNIRRPVMDMRPPPRPGVPREPTAQAVEPSIPAARLGRRCLTTEKPRRQPDKVTGEVISSLDGPNINNDVTDGRGTSVGANMRIQCPGCGVTLQVPKGTIVVECPHCQGIHPTVTCRLVPLQGGDTTPSGG